MMLDRSAIFEGDDIVWQGPMATRGHSTHGTLPLREMGLPQARAASQIKETKGQVQKAELGSPQEAKDSPCLDQKGLP